jgi:16S rRNA processing protein RimM
MESSKPSTDKLRIGHIRGVHGIRGELCLCPDDEAADWVGELETVFFRRPNTLDLLPMSVLSMRWKGDDVLLSVEAIPDRSEAERWRGTEVFANEADLPALEEDTFRPDQLIGLTVHYLASQEPCGQVVDFLTSSGEVFLEIQPAPDRQPVVIPFQESFFPEIDLESGRIWLDKIEDLMDLSPPLESKAKQKRERARERKGQKRTTPNPETPTA